MLFTLFKRNYLFPLQTTEHASGKTYPLKLKPHLLETLDVTRALSPKAYAALEAANEALVIHLLERASEVCAKTGAKTIGPEQVRAALLGREFDFLALLFQTRRPDAEDAGP